MKCLVSGRLTVTQERIVHRPQLTLLMKWDLQKPSTDSVYHNPVTYINILVDHACKFDDRMYCW